MKKIVVYDTTLRDGAQTYGVDFSVSDKRVLFAAMDKIGFDYIEGGWPGANPVDDAFFSDLPKAKRAAVTTFGMTHRADKKAEEDQAFLNLFQANTKAVTLVGKTWDFHVKVALGISKERNLELIRDSVAFGVKQGKEVLFDAEHFFDGYKANPEYALSCLKAAKEAGATWLVLCDTNGGLLPDEIYTIVCDVKGKVPFEQYGIHSHDDTGNAVANSLAAVRAGCLMVQGTLNGLGERCGNANLLTVIPNLMLKMDLKTNLSMDDLKGLTSLSHLLNERLGQAPFKYSPYVGEAAFTHKAGLHVSALVKNSALYEHISPEVVGNNRRILVSSQAGKSNVLAMLRTIGVDPDTLDKKVVTSLLDQVKKSSMEGLTYDGAEASFELLVREILGEIPNYFQLTSFRVVDERRYNALGKLVISSDATCRVMIGDQSYLEAADGEGPVDALGNALQKTLLPIYPELADLKLYDYKVRILSAEKGTAAVPRVMIESGDSSGKRWSTVGASVDVIDASFKALLDSFIYKLYLAGVPSRQM